MANFTKTFDSTIQIIGTSDDFITLSADNSYATSGSVVNLLTSGYEGVQVFCEVEFDSTPTDDIEVKVYASLDDSDFDTIPLYSTSIDTTDDSGEITRITMIIKDVAYFKVVMAQNGSTDSHDVRAYVRPWYWTNT